MYVENMQEEKMQEENVQEENMKVERMGEKEEHMDQGEEEKQEGVTV